jgi:hypothetical protein
VAQKGRIETTKIQLHLLIDKIAKLQFFKTTISYALVNKQQK